MATLSDADVRLMLVFLHAAVEVEGADPFPEPVLAALRELIPSDLGAALVEFDGRDPAVSDDALTLLSFAEIDGAWCFGDQPPWTDELEEVCRVHIEADDPIPPLPAFLNQPIRISDVLSSREHHARPLYAEVERVVGAEDTLRLWLSVPGESTLRRFDFSSSRRGGVSERDALVLTLLVPHLRQLYARAAARRSSHGVFAQLTSREREILALVARGRTNREIAVALWISPHTVRTHLEHVFEKLSVRTRAAAVACVFAGDPQEGSLRSLG
jgi:DNA-binding CsgD family transcriptional regulator